VVTIDHPPMNLLDAALGTDLNGLQAELAADDGLRVVVFRSADPEYFVAHADLAMIRGLPRDAATATEAMRGIHGFMERWRTLDKVTIARLVGRARALEIVTGCADFDALMAERYGWVNRALPADEIGPFVDALARRIASFPPHAIRLAKQAVDAGAASFEDGLAAERAAFAATVADPDLDARFDDALAAGLQTRDAELDLDALLDAFRGR